MRILAGSLKGRRIEVPQGLPARAATGRIRESVFGILGARVGGARVLDLFAGAGSFGLESLSRGAAEAVFVDKAPECVKAIKKNLDILGIEGRVLAVTAAEALKELSAGDEVYDIIFVDPPFAGAKRDVREVLENLGRTGVLRGGGTLVARCHFKTVLPRGSGRLEISREERYGENSVAFYGHGRKVQ